MRSGYSEYLFCKSSSSIQCEGFWSSILRARSLLKASFRRVCREIRKAINSSRSADGRCAAWSLSCANDMGGG